MKKRILAMLLTVAAMLTLLMTAALADDAEAQTEAGTEPEVFEAEDPAELDDNEIIVRASGTLGDNITWQLTNQLVLTISGTGDIPDYEPPANEIPWRALSVKQVIISDGITSIGNSAFYCMSNIQSVTIPDSVTRIGDYAFYMCSSLTSVQIPDSVTSIGDYAFHMCTAMTSLSLGNGVTTIGKDAFYYCKALTSVEIPDSVTSIGRYAFDACSSLTDVSFGNGVKSIGEYAFAGSGVTDVAYPSSMTDIGKGVFESCKALQHVEIPGSVTTIAEYAFSGCTSLTGVELPDSITTIGESAFLDCGLTNVEIPSGITTISESTFSCCDSLTSVTIPQSVIEIGKSAFSSSGLVSVEIPDSVTTIGENAFESCRDLASITIPDSVTSLGEGAFELCKGLKSAVIGNGIETIPANVFSYCDSMTDVTFGNNVTDVEAYAFSDCTGLTGVHISDLAAWCAIDYSTSGCYENNPIYYAHNLYLNDTLITDLVIPEDVAQINSYAFYECTSLTSVTIPDSVGRIGSEAFYGCSNLTSVTSAAGYYDMWAFGNCPKINQLTFTGSAPYVTICSYGYQDENGNIISEEQGPFPGVTAIAYYPANNKSWDDTAFEHIGAAANLTWIANGAPACTHTWNDGVITTAAACTSDGVRTYTCTSCGKTRTEVVPATGHSWNDGVITTAATTSSEGVRTYTCTVCGETKTEVIPVRESPFDDVQNSARYYYKPILWANNQNITNGYPDGTFRPNDNCTRGQIVTFLWRAYGSPEPQTTVNPFKDVAEGRYYYKAILWAVEQGITSGKTADTFDPNGVCTRAQAVTFIWRAAGKPEPKTTVNKFTDVLSGKYYYKAVLWAVENGITNGMSENTFCPDNTCTRGNIVTFLYRAEQAGALGSGE